MKKYEGNSIRKVKTHTAKLPDNIGFPGQGGGGVIDKSGIGPFGKKSKLAEIIEANPGRIILATIPKAA